MAEKQKSEEEYVSDVDDAPLPAVRRRATASDDTEEDEGGGGGTGSPPLSGVVGCDADSDADGQGAAELYDEDEGSEECEEVSEEFDACGGGGDAKEVADEVVAAPEDEGKYEEEGEAGAGTEAAVEGEDKEKKESKHYAVPRTGAFYMHDDRIQNQENGGHGRQREFFGGQKLWCPKDNRLWLHDRFDEMNIRHVQHDNGRRPIGLCGARAGSRDHGVDHGYIEGTKSRSYYHDDRTGYKYNPQDSRTRCDSTKNYNRFPKEPNTSYDNGKNYRIVPRKFRSYYDDKNFDYARRESRSYYGSAPNVYRGRHSRPFQPHWNNTFEISSVQNNTTYARTQSEEACSNVGVGRHSYQTLSRQNLPRKKTFAPNLNSASLPFHPSRSSRQEPPLIQRRKAQPGIFSKLFSSSVRMAHGSLKPQSRPIFRVKVAIPSGGHGNAVDSLSTVAVEGMLSPTSSSVSTTNNYRQYSKSRDQGRGSNVVYQQRSVQQPYQPTPRASTQMFRPKIAGTDKIQSHPQSTPTSSTEDAETSAPPGSNDSVALSVGIVQNDEKVESAFSPYGGGHVLSVTGAMGLTLGDQAFDGSPALLPVMHLSGQHPTVTSTPSIGIALPGFLAHQQQGGISEMGKMTWLPILIDAIGALGTTSNPTYFGSYYPQPSLSSSVSPRDHSATEVPVSLNPQEIQEVVGHEPGERKNKLRRFDCLNFATLFAVVLCTGLAFLLGLWYSIARSIISPKNQR